MPIGIKILPTERMGANATIVTSNTVIGIVGSSSLIGVGQELLDLLEDSSQAGLLYFSDADQALEVFKDLEGTIREDLRDIQQQNVKSPVIISLVELKEEHDEKTYDTFYDDAEFKSAILVAIENLKKARTIFATRIKIIIASWFSFDESVQNALISFSTGTKTIAMIDLALNSVAEALPILKEHGSQRTLVFPFYRKAWSIFSDEQIQKPNSAIVAGHIAYQDALKGEFGRCFDHANELINDVEGSLVPLTYEEGEDTCEVNTLVNAGACLIINDDGNRLYNFETPSEDTRFNKLETIRFFDLLNENIQIALKQHKHRPMTDVLSLAKADVEAFLIKAVNSGAAIGAEVWWSDKNTPAEISAGLLYMDYKAGNNVGVRSIVIQPYSTTEYYTVETE